MYVNGLYGLEPDGGDSRSFGFYVIVFFLFLRYVSLSLILVLISSEQVAHIPGALFFDVDGVSDRATNVRLYSPCQRLKNVLFGHIYVDAS